jgi:hypothetical protein
MADKIEVTVTDLEKKHDGKTGYENMYSLYDLIQILRSYSRALAKSNAFKILIKSQFTLI